MTMAEIKVVTTIPPNECVLTCKGWTISFVWDRPIEEPMHWEEFHGSVSDLRPGPCPPNFEPLRPLKPLTREERWAARKRAFGIIQQMRYKARAKAREEVRRAAEEPKML